MNKVGQRGIHTQRQLLRFFANNLDFRYQGNWEERRNCLNVFGLQRVWSNIFSPK